MDNKLGCFGSVLYFKLGTARCKACPLQAECEVETAANKAKIKDWYKDLLESNKTTTREKRQAKRGIKAVSTPAASPRVEHSVTASKPLHSTGKMLNKKPKEHVDAWCKKGIDFGAYKNGDNPFRHSGNKFAVVAMDFIMAKKRCTRLELTEEFIEKLDWKSGTACSHTNITFDAFEYLGIIIIQDGQAVLI